MALRKTMRKLWIGAAAVLLGLLVLILWPAPADRGRARFFNDLSYNFEAVRVLNDVAAAGGDSGEALQAIAAVKAGDADSWYAAWLAAGDRTFARSHQINDAQSRGNALLRAHTYYRSAEFFLLPEDARRADAYRKNVSAFYQGLDAQGVIYERSTIVYGSHHLNAVYYPGPAGAETRPLLTVVGGYDSTLEELYLGIGAAAHQRGFSVLTYEGPGQGAVLREQGLTMQADWEKPNTAVLDAFLSNHSKPRKIVLLGESLGGYLAPRAAAFDPRIDGVVAYDIWYDGYAIATRHVPSFIFWLHAHGYDALLESLARRNPDSGSRWAVANGQWVFGVHGMFDVLDAFKAYRLAPVAAQIKQDVLLLAGTEDHFVPIEQLEVTQKALTAARSVTAVSFDAASGGGLHCQMGAPSLWQAVLFDWMAAKFGPATAAN
jgi:alpha-beta hydrolase superfamily lysophospholipase